MEQCSEVTCNCGHEVVLDGKPARKLQRTEMGVCGRYRIVHTTCPACGGILVEFLHAEGGKRVWAGCGKQVAP
jgi:hypothetical protein